MNHLQKPYEFLKTCVLVNNDFCGKLVFLMKDLKLFQLHF